MEVEELGYKFEVDEGVFYNPHMRLSRELSSALVATLGKLKVLDGFSASGIRGILYALKGRAEVEFLDIDERAVENIKRNLKRHGIGGKIHRAEFNAFIWDRQDYNFIELDPFGSPSPYLYAAIRSLRNKKHSYLSLTATDTAVLCGVHRKACVKAYASIPMRSYFCHEVGLRILIKKVVETAASFDLAFKPLLSFYYRHQMKVIGELRKSAELAYRAMEELGYIYYDGKSIRASKEPGRGKGESYAGWVWLGKLHDEGKLREMKGYVESKEGKRMVEMFIEENSYPPYHYDIHEVASILKVNAPKREKLIEKAKERGIDISRTHFSPTGIKTTATFEELSELFLTLSEKQ